MNILTALKTTLAAFPQTERRVALAQFLSRYVNTDARITNYRCIGKDADAIDMFLRNIGMDESVYTLVRSKFDNDTALIKWNPTSTEKVITFVKDVGRAMTTNCLMKLYAGIVLEPNEESVVQDVGTVETTTEHWSKNIQKVTDDIFGGETNVHFATLGEIERHAWENNLTDPSVQLPPVPLFVPQKDSLVRDDVSVRYMKPADSLTFMPGLTTAPLRALLAAEAESNPLNNFLYQRKETLSEVNDLGSRDHLLVVNTGWVNTTNRLDAMRIIEFLSNPKKLWAYISMLYRVVYKVQCTVTPWSRVAVNNIRTQDSDPYPHALRDNSGWGTIRCDVDHIGSFTQMVVLASVILTPCSASCTSVKSGYTNIPDATPIPLVTPDKTHTTDDAKETINDQNYLAVSDLGAEWFATVHGIYMNNNTGTRTERIENFRKMCSQIIPAEHTNISGKVADPSRDRPELVFVNGCAIALRQFFDKMERIPEFQKDARNIITDIYSGIITDTSASVAAYVTGGKDSFPDVLHSSHNADNSIFFGSLNTEEGSKVQLRMAPRKDPSNSRRYAIVLKTSLKTSTFLNLWGACSTYNTRNDVISTISRSFLNAYIFRGDDPAAATGFNTPSSSHVTQMIKDLLSEFDLSCPSDATDMAMSNSCVLNSTELSEFDLTKLPDRAKYVGLTFISDSDDYLYLVIVPPLMLTVTARLMYRARSGLPIATQSLARKLNQIRSNGSLLFTTYVSDSESSPTAYYDKYIAAIMKDKWLSSSLSNSHSARALMEYPDSNLTEEPEKSILMDLWGTLYLKEYLNETGLNSYKGYERNYLTKIDFVNIAGSELQRNTRVSDIVFGTSES